MCGAAERFQNGVTIFFLVVMTGAMVSGYRWRKSLRHKFNIKGRHHSLSLIQGPSFVVISG